MLELLIILSIVGIIWFLRKGKSRSSLSSFKLKNSLPVGKILVIALLILVSVFWGEILQFIGGWFAETPTGAALHFGAADVEANRKWIDPLMAIIGLLILYMVWQKGKRYPSTLGQRTDGVEIIDAILGNISLIILILASSGIALVVVSIIGGVTFAMTDADEKIVHAVKIVMGDKPADCEQEKMIDVFPAGRNVFVCKDTGEIFLMPVLEHVLVYDFAPDFKEKNKHRNLKIEDYVAVDKPLTYYGSIAGSYRLRLRETIKHQYTAGWDQTDIDQVKVFVKAVPMR